VRKNEEVQSKVFDNDHEARIGDMLMAKVERKLNPNADLLKAVQDHTIQIIDFNENAESDRPVIVLDFQRQQIQVHHYDDYKARLRRWSPRRRRGTGS